MERLRLCIFSADAARHQDLLESFNDAGGVTVLTACSSWEELRTWLRHATTDVVAVHLDDAGELGFKVVERIGQAAPEIQVIGLSETADSQTILAAMRAGCSQFLPVPIDTGDLKSILSKIDSRRQAVTHQSRKICVLGSSGGVGATTVACNLAMELAQLVKRRTAIVDMNLEFGDVACAFDCEPQYSVSDVCKDGVDVDRVLLAKAMHQLPCEVSLLARPGKIDDAYDVTPEGIQQALHVMAEMFPFVVVDLPRTFSFLSAAAVSEADRILIITQLNVPAIRNATRIYQCLDRMGAKDENIEIVLNRCKANFERITPDEVESHFGRPLFAMIPNDYRRIQSSVDLGHPVMADAPESPVRLAILDMARQLAGELEGAESPAQQNAGLLGRFLKRPVKAVRT